ncbi:MAG TPA: hypothetical protein VGM43_15655 [Bryobacteraceae bacterium]|jgi:hypothetical protein
MSGEDQIQPDPDTDAENSTKRVPVTGKSIWMAPDFDEPLSDFEEYM